MDYHALHGHDVSSFDLPSTRELYRYVHTNNVPTNLTQIACRLSPLQMLWKI